jgi:predicted nuclease of predicted toxin-antitoxin system
VSVPLYFDHNVDLAIVAGLRRRGVDVLTAREDGAHTTDDEILLERATALGRVLVSNDKDFSAITARWYREGRHFTGLIRTRQENISIGMMIDDLEIIAGIMEPGEMIDQIEYVPFPPGRA